MNAVIGLPCGSLGRNRCGVSNSEMNSYTDVLLFLRVFNVWELANFWLQIRLRH